MTTRNCDGGKWEIIADTTPSGVAIVTHTGLENYDWIYCSYENVELSSSGYVVMQLGYGATPTIVNTFYLSAYNGTSSQYFSLTQIFTRTASTTTDGNGTLLIPNMNRLENAPSELSGNPFISGGHGIASSSSTGNVGMLQIPKVPLTAVRYGATAGNMQGTGANIKTWGWRG